MTDTIGAGGPLVRKNGIDVERARAETPGCAHVRHFDSAGSSLPPAPVLDAVIGHLRLEARMGGYEAAAAARESVERVYAVAAELLHAAPDEIAVVENATRAWDMAFYSLPLGPGDRILTTVAEYGSNYLAYLQVARRTGAIVDVVPNDETGQISVEALRRAVDERVKLISITHVPTNGGLVNPAAAVGKVAREAGIPYLLDACQSVGQMPIDVEAIGCDMLSVTGRKFLRGPRGTGLLYVRRALLERLEPPFLDVHAARWTERGRYEVRPDARRFENWETNYSTKIGLAVAIDYALGWGLHAIRDRVYGLAATLRERLAAVPGVTVRDLGAEKCGIVTFTLAGRTATEVKASLAAEAIHVGTSSQASTRLDMEARGLTELVRASVHYYTTEEEIGRLTEHVSAFSARRPRA